MTSGAYDLVTAAGRVHVRIPVANRLSESASRLAAAALELCRCPAPRATWTPVDGFACDADFGVAELSGAVPAGDVRRLLNALLHCRYLHHGLLTLHAIAVARAGQVVMLIGGHGTGKTLTALALHERGWRLLAGDVCVVGPDGEFHGGTTAVTVRAGALHRYLPDVARRFHAEPAGTEDIGDRLAVSSAGATHPVSAVVQVRVESRDRPVWSPVPEHVRRSALYQASGHQLDRVLESRRWPLHNLEAPELTQVRLDLVTRLAGRVPAWTSLGSPAQIATAVEGLERSAVLR
jgi:hypothetical protein